MTKAEAHKLIDNWKVGTFKDLKFGVSAKETVRLDFNKFEINDTTDGWQVAYVSRLGLVGLLTGKIQLSNLDWR